MSSTKALARVFTNRVKRSGSNANPPSGRNINVRHPRGVIDRGLISLPTELISTTNVQVLTAPSIPAIARSSSGSSVSSGSESEFSTIDRSFLDRSTESGSSTPITPPMESGDSFFGPKAGASISSEPLDFMLPDAPILPKRAPSHSKKAHMELSRKLSLKRLSPPPTSLATSTVSGGADLLNTANDPSHPFSQELAKVAEVAEEFGELRTVIYEEEQDLYSKGLRKYTVDDYLDEIAGIYSGVFENRLGIMANPWV